MSYTFSKQQAEKRLQYMMPEDVRTLFKAFSASGSKLYLVGGCVRDAMIIGRIPKDFDVCTDAMPDRVIEILKSAGIEYNLQGEHFAVVVAKMSGGDYEIATFRDDVSYSDNRHPEVKLGVTIDVDVQRRDFTINALFMDIETGQIIDLVGGIDDIHAGVVRCVGVAKDRFAEDHLRKLRAVRFASRFAFAIHPDTMKAIQDDPTLSISRERVVNEFTTAYHGSAFRHVLVELLYETKLVHQVFQGMLVEPMDIQRQSIGWSSINGFIASIVCPCNTDIAKKLQELGFTTSTGYKTAPSVEFIHSFKGLATKPMQFHNKLKSVHVRYEDFKWFHPGVEGIWLFRFKPTDGLAEKLMADGFKGKELGVELDRIYTHAFITGVFKMKHWCSWCECYTDSVSIDYGRPLCDKCSAQYDNKTGHCSFECCMTGHCDDTC